METFSEIALSPSLQNALISVRKTIGPNGSSTTDNSQEPAISIENIKKMATISRFLLPNVGFYRKRG